MHITFKEHKSAKLHSHIVKNGVLHYRSVALHFFPVNKKRRRELRCSAPYSAYPGHSTYLPILVSTVAICTPVNFSLYVYMLYTPLDLPGLVHKCTIHKCTVVSKTFNCTLEHAQSTEELLLSNSK